MANTSGGEWLVGTRISKPGYGYFGEVRGWETKFRTRWCVVQWDGRPFTVLENPSALEVAPAPLPGELPGERG